MKNKIVYIDFNNGRLCNNGGSVLMDPPSVIMGSKPTIEFHFAEWSDGNMYLPNMSDATSFKAAIDTDLDIETPPMTTTASSGIVISGLPSGIVKVPIDATTSGFIEKVNGKDTLPAWMELYGKDTNGDIIYDYRFRINCKGTVELESGGGGGGGGAPETLHLRLYFQPMGERTYDLILMSTTHNGKAWYSTNSSASVAWDDADVQHEKIFFDGTKWMLNWTSGSYPAEITGLGTDGDYPAAGTYTTDYGMLGSYETTISY